MRCVAALALAVAAVRQVAAQGTPITEPVFDNLIQYARWARASYADKCNTPPNGSTVLSYFNDASADAQATLFQWDQGRQIIIAFRGTSTPADWNSDLDFLPTGLTAPGASCSACQVHEGFQKQYNAIAAPVISAVKSAVASTGYSVIVTGHSLGGAMASIGTASLGGSGVKISAVYTYGEPRNGNSQFSDYIATFVPVANYFRVTHANDGVPSIPPSILGYNHHGNEYWMQTAGFGNTAASTVMCTSAADSENLNCNLAQNSGGNPINYAHVSYCNDVTGNPLHIHDCGAPYP